ncbi:MAG: hypothetical protein QXX23_07325, partial [Thermoplasmata archaeon]
MIKDLCLQNIEMSRMKRVINNYLIEDEGDTLRISKLDSDDDFELNVVRLSKFEIQRIDGTFIYFM